MVKHLDTGNKFLMYPIFMQVFLDKQVNGMSKHNAIDVIPSHTKQIFRKMKRVGKETPLFSTMLVQAQAVMGEAQEISSLKKRVNRLEKKSRSRTHGLKRLYKVGLSARVESSAEEQSLGEEDASKQGRNIADIDADAETTLVNETAEDKERYNDEEMFDTWVLDDEEVVVEKAVVVKEVNAAQDQVSAATTTVVKDLTVDDITLAKELEALKTSKPKIKRIIVRDHKEPSESTTIPTSIADSTRPKAKGILKKMNKKGLISETAQHIKEANLAWDDLQAKIKADFDLAQRIQAEELKQLTDANMDGWKPRALKNKYFVEIKELFDKAMIRINNFVDFRTKMVEENSKKAEESSSKRAGDELEQESAKKHKVDDDQEAAKLKRCLEIVPDDEDDVTIDATPLSSKSPTIIDYKIHKEGRKIISKSSGRW
nr:hypothetical protein [Tanacetum cinerariifolium]